MVTSTCLLRITIKRYEETLPSGSLTGLYIYSQSSDSPVIGPISNGQTIQSSSLPNAYYLSVQTSGAIESVILNVDGSVITENVVLYTFPGNAENGTNWTNGIGSHTVSATGYNQDNGLGQQCGNISLTFTITGGCQNVTSSGSIMANSTVLRSVHYHRKHITTKRWIRNFGICMAIQSQLRKCFWVLRNSSECS